VHRASLDAQKRADLRQLIDGSSPRGGGGGGGGGTGAAHTGDGDAFGDGDGDDDEGGVNYVVLGGGGGGGAGAAEEEGGGGGGSDGGEGAVADASVAAAADNTASSSEVSIGSDVAFAMDEGTGSTRRIRCWIGRVVKLFKGKAAWRRPVAVDGDLAADIFAVCEWYSEVQQPNRLKFRFRQVTDRTKYCFVNFIGVVRIDFDSDASSRSKEDRYTITQEQRSRLDESLKLTTPVRRGGKMTVAEQQQKEAQQKEEIVNQARPRMSHIRPSQHRAASRGNSSAAASSSSSSSSSCRR
jgi:hypothetical protein